MRFLTVASVCAAASLLNPLVRAQCEPQWLPGDGLPGLNGGVYASVMWDPDGAGPQSPLLVVGGKFTVAGNIFANHIAAWDGLHWSTFGTGLTHGDQVSTTVDALTVLDGDLVAGGIFTNAGGVGVNHIARWNGSSWAPLGSGVTGSALDSGVRALAVMPNGDLAVGGKFSSAGGITPTTNNLAKWDGASWSPIVQGTNTQSNTSVEALLVLPNGHLVAGGNFSSIGGFNRQNVALWDGAGWVALGTGVNSWVHALAILPSGDLAAGGNFTTAGGNAANYLARWNGASWSSMNAGLGGAVEALSVVPNGDLYVGGQFDSGVWGAAHNVARWDGVSWSAIGARINGLVYTLASLPEGGVAAGGTITDIAGVNANSLVLWTGSGWVAPGSGIGDRVIAMAVMSNGDVVAGGSFTAVGNTRASRVARWNGLFWEPLGLGIGANPFDSVNSLLPLPNGDLIAGGQFRTAGGILADFIARWDGQEWSSLDGGMEGTFGLQDVHALLAMPNGDLVAAGGFSSAGGVPAAKIARWDGDSWSAIGAGFNTAVYALALMPNGDIVAGGQFTSSGSATRYRVARWDGTAWRAIGSGMNASATTVYALAVHPNGDLIAGGLFTLAGGVTCNKIARWDGLAWSSLGAGMDTQGNRGVRSLAIQPNGDIIAGGNFVTAGGTLVNSIARWNGTTWSAMGSGLAVVDGTLASVTALALHPNGEVLAGGTFQSAGGQVSSYFARWSDDPAPLIARNPEDRFVGTGSTATLTSTPAVGYSNVSFQWQRNGVDIADGPGGASVGGGDVSGASGMLASRTDGSAAVLMITGAQPSDGGEYTVVFTNTCGDATSDAATLTVNCAADFDSDGFVTGADFDLYVQAFEAGELTSDFDGDGFITGADFDLYVQVYEQGC